jgi:hypothetical protein
LYKAVAGQALSAESPFHFSPSFSEPVAISNSFNSTPIIISHIKAPELVRSYPKDYKKQLRGIPGKQNKENGPLIKANDLPTIREGTLHPVQTEVITSYATSSMTEIMYMCIFCEPVFTHLSFSVM